MISLGNRWPRYRLSDTHPESHPSAAAQLESAFLCPLRLSCCHVEEHTRKEEMRQSEPAHSQCEKPGQIASVISAHIPNLTNCSTASRLRVVPPKQPLRPIHPKEKFCMDLLTNSGR